MIQIIGLLLCVYLVYKGVEILQIGLSSTRQDIWHMILGWLSFFSSLAIAILFAYWLIIAGEAMSNNATEMPPRPPTQYFPR